MNLTYIKKRILLEWVSYITRVIDKLKNKIFITNIRQHKPTLSFKPNITFRCLYKISLYKVE